MRTHAISACALALVLLPATSALAGSHDFIVYNNLSTPVSSLRVTGGTVENFQRVGSGKQQTVKVTLPDGQCAAYVRVRTEGGSVIEGQSDVCSDGGLVVTLGPNGPRVLPFNDVMIPN